MTGSTNPNRCRQAQRGAFNWPTRKFILSGRNTSKSAGESWCPWPLPKTGLANSVGLEIPVSICTNANAFGQLVVIAPSGFTTGMVTGTNASVPVKYEPEPKSVRPWFKSTFHGQITIQGGFGVFSRGGDSGSLVVEAQSNRPVGLLFAGNPQGVTFANPIQQVIQALDIELINAEV